MKKVLSLILSLALVAGMLPTAAIAAPVTRGQDLPAEEPVPPVEQTELPKQTSPDASQLSADSGYCGAEGDGSNLQWSYANHVLTIRGTGKMKDYYNSWPYDNGYVPWAGHKRELYGVVIEAGVTSIGNYAFGEHTATESITIPSSVTEIGEDAFYNCGIWEIDLPEGLTTLAEGAIYNCPNLTTASIPASLSIVASGFLTWCPKLKNIYVDSNNSQFCVDKDGVLFSKDKTTLLRYPVTTERTSYAVPQSVISIGNMAFYNCVALTNIAILGSLEKISNRAFWGCIKLRDINIPKSAVEIGEFSFYGCCSLANITIPDGAKKISHSAFDGCAMLKDIHIPNSVTEIGSSAFGDCTGLTSVTIPSSITCINPLAFKGCSSLSAVWFEGAAPSYFSDYDVFRGCAKDFIIRYPLGAAGWTTPTWHGYKTAIFDASVDSKITSTFTVKGDSYNLAEDSVGFLPDSRIPAQFVARVNAGLTPMVTTYHLKQGTTVKATSTSGVFKDLMIPELFQAGEQIFVEAKVSGLNRPVVQELKLSVLDAYVPQEVHPQAIFSEYIRLLDPEKQNYGLPQETFAMCREIISEKTGPIGAFFAALANASGLSKALEIFFKGENGLSEDWCEAAAEKLFLEIAKTSEVAGDWSVIDEIYAKVSNVDDIADNFTKIGRLESEDIEKVTNAITEHAAKIKKSGDKAANKGWKALGEGKKLVKYFATCLALHKASCKVIDTMIKWLELSDSKNGDLLPQLYIIREDMEKNPGVYIVEHYFEDKVISELAKKVAEIVGNGETLVQVANLCLKVYAVAYEDILGLPTSEDMVRTICYSNYNESLGAAMKILKSQLIDDKIKGVFDPSKMVDYEILYNAYFCSLKELATCSKDMLKGKDYRIQSLESRIEIFEKGCSYQAFLSRCQKAAAQTITNDYEYYIVNGQAVIAGRKAVELAGYSANLLGATRDIVSPTLVIPEQIGGHPVKSVSPNAFENDTSISMLYVPDTVTSIGAKAFRNCTALENTVLGSHVSYIGERAFEGCRELRDLKLPDQITSIEPATFKNCTALNYVEIPRSVLKIQAEAFSGNSGLELLAVNATSQLSVDASAFTGTSTGMTVSGATDTAASAISQSLAVTYQKTEIPVASIKIVAPAEYTSCELNEAIRLDGLCVSATDRNQHTEDVTDKIGVACDTSVAGQRDAVISYADKLLTYPVTVNKADQTAPSAPSKFSATATSIVLGAVTGNGSGTLEYGYRTANDTDPSHWQEGTTFAGLTAATAYLFYTRFAGNRNYNPAVSTVGTEIYTAAAKPTLIIDYSAETLATTAEMEYSADNGANWTGCTATMSVASLGWVGIVKQVQFRVRAVANGAPASAEENITIPARPAMPTGLTVTNESAGGLNNGKITGITDLMEYKIKDGGWVDCTKTEITSLSPGTYSVRLKAVTAGSKAFAGEAATVIIATGAAHTYTLNVTAPSFAPVTVGYAIPPDAEVITIVSTGNSDATISGVALGGAGASKFTLNKTDGTTITAGSINSTAYTVQPSGGLAAGTYTATITVTYNSSATTTATVTFTVNPNDPGGGTGGTGGTGGAGGAGGTGGTGGAGGNVTSGNGNDTITPKTPAVDMSKYTDLIAGKWYYEAAVYVLEHGLFAGTSDTTFSPDTPMSRAMLMTVLSRADGQDTTAPAGGAWYDAGMKWAMEQGISDGTNPDANITRESLVVMLYRYAKAEKAEGDLTKFTDGDKVSTWAADAMSWAVQAGILQGSGGALNPAGNATRAEVATIMQRFVEFSVK